MGTSIDLAYDPAGRLQETDGAGITLREMQYDGLDLIAEYDSTGTLTARYVHGPGADEPLVQYAGTSVSTRQWLLADERGSIVAVTDWSGAAIQINSYDEYGAPAPGNAGRFGYTGQVWLPETGLYHYKNRAYNPELGRFMQTDPIGVNGGMNLYAYVGGDPVNLVDPLGLRQAGNVPPPCDPQVDSNCDTITIIAPPMEDPCFGSCMLSTKDILEALYGGWGLVLPVYDFYDTEGNYLGGASGETSCNQDLMVAGNAAGVVGREFSSVGSKFFFAGVIIAGGSRFVPHPAARGATFAFGMTVAGGGSGIMLVGEVADVGRDMLHAGATEGWRGASEVGARASYDKAMSWLTGRSIGRVSENLMRSLDGANDANSALQRMVQSASRMRSCGN